MKKIYFILAALCVAAVSCTKEPVQPEEAVKPGVDNVDKEDVYQGAIPMEFKAVTDETKTTIGENVGGTRKISWEAGDKIKVIWAENSTEAAAASAGATTTFTANVDEADAYYAVYPAAATSSLAEGAVTVTIPDVQDVSAGFNAAHYAVAVAKEGNLAFKNVCGWLKFEISDPTIKRVLIRGNGEQAVTCDVTVTFDENGDIASYKTTAGKSRLTVDINGVGEYYVAVNPYLNLANGVGFRFYTSKGYKEDGSPAYENAIETGVFNDKALTINRGAIRNLGDINSRIVKDWYISPDGTGDGKSAANPANGVEFLRAKLAQDVTSDATKRGLAKGYGCIDITIHAAAGTYDFGGEQIHIAWPGHTSLVGTSIEGAADGSTVFTNTTGTSRFFTVDQSVALTLKNVKLTGGNAGEESGGAIHIAHANAKLALDNCVLDGNKALKGGALYVGAAETVSLNKCTIANNTAVQFAGGIHINNKANVFLNACAVFNNENTTSEAKECWGAAIFVNNTSAESNLCINNSTISDHKTVAESNDTNIDVQGGSLVFANSTMLASTTAGMLRVHNHDNSKDGTFINSILINKKSTDATKDQLRSVNFNAKNGVGYLVSKYVISGVPQNRYRTIKIDDTNEKCVTYENLGNPAFDETYNVYKWDGTLTGNDVDEYNYNSTNKTFAASDNPHVRPSAATIEQASDLILTANADFHAWLTELGALDVDQLGNSRSTNRQGAYCGN